MITTTTYTYIIWVIFDSNLILIFTETQNSLQNFSGLSAAESAAYEEKNPLSQRKELWIFWYGDKPEELFKRLVSPELKDVPDIAGTWENVLPYEARTLLYKALNNLIER